MSFPPTRLGYFNVGIVSVCAFIAFGTLASAHAKHEHEESVPEVVNPEISAPRLSVSEYRSPLSAYQPYEEAESPGWKEANDRVGEIGGWRVYAREAFESEDESGDTEKDSQ